MFLALEDVLNWVLPIALGLLIGFVIATRGKGNIDQIIYMDPEEFRANMRKGQLIDIRKEDEYNLEKVNGSRNFPGREILGNLSKLRTDQAVFLYANTDSGQVKAIAKKLVKKGYKPVYILKGGMVQWPFTKK